MEKSVLCERNITFTTVLHSSKPLKLPPEQLIRNNVGLKEKRVEADVSKLRKEIIIPITIVLSLASIILIAVIIVYHCRRKRRKQDASIISVNDSQMKSNERTDMKLKSDIGGVPNSSKIYPTIVISSEIPPGSPVITSNTPPPICRVDLKRYSSGKSFSSI
ncbi:unnamed protein product [Heterobilharzia americana]|nr:unnamed protein product [Heterobilharzia americana]